MRSSHPILNNIQYRWQAIKYGECLLYGISAGWGAYLLISEWTLVVGLIAGVLSGLLIRPWQIDLQRVADLLDRKFPGLENSTSLLIEPGQGMSVLMRLQQKKITDRLHDLPMVWPPHHLLRTAILSAIIAVTGYSLHIIIQTFPEKPVLKEVNPVGEPVSNGDRLQLRSTPTLRSVEVRIDPPAYTGLRNSNTSDLNVKAIEQSRVQWTVTTNEIVEAVYLEVSGASIRKFKRKGSDEYILDMVVKENALYNFKLIGSDSSQYTTELFRLEVVADQPPVVTLGGIDPYTSFTHTEEKHLVLNCDIRDDYGISDAYIIATVSKGSGESVKFREEKLMFDQQDYKEKRSDRLVKTIDLDELDMTPGDELYFYVEALDNRSPVAQKTRTDTYFISIQDTTSTEFSIAGSLGVDLMPEYFRSQRQLIIDTERLIKEKPSIVKHDFNSRSNELGFDQKALRLKYGQFMGVEDDSGIAIEDHDLHDEETDNGEDEDDPVAAYTHDHDGDNEHNLLPQHNDPAEEKTPLAKFVHDHDDPEEATLYTQSVRSMLKAAMAEMWDAELYLRLYEPEKSLPYQYKALELIKQIKNHSRIYVHRIGFDPPPLKEDKRLTGDIKEVETTTAKLDREEPDKFQPLRQTVTRIEELVNLPIVVLSKSDRVLFGEASKVLASLAIEQPVRYLKTLERVKKLTANEVESKNLQYTLKAVGTVIATAIPIDWNDPRIRSTPKDKLTNNFLQNLSRRELDDK